MESDTGTCSPRYAIAATGSFSHLARFLLPWSGGEPSLEGAEQEEPARVRVRMLDPMTGRAISTLTGAALSVKPRGR
jgi:hypothetical protein